MEVIRAPLGRADRRRDWPVMCLRWGHVPDGAERAGECVVAVGMVPVGGAWLA